MSHIDFVLYKALILIGIVFFANMMFSFFTGKSIEEARNENSGKLKTINSEQKSLEHRDK